jgi:hypothetical protein
MTELRQKYVVLPRAEQYNVDMAQVESIPGTYADAVRILADSYGASGADDLVIFALEDQHDNTIRLIQLSDAFPDLGGIRVYRFRCSAEFPFRSAVAPVRPEQWERIRSGGKDPELPADWSLTTARQVWPLGDSSQP